MSPPARAPNRALWFVILNLVAVGAAVALFLIFLFGHSLDRVVRPTTQAVLSWDALMVLVAASPIFAAILVGIGYRKMAARRRRLELEHDRSR